MTEGAVGRLLDLLDLEEAGSDRFRGRTGGEGGRRLFGGHVAAQALRAATRTVRAEHGVSSLRAYFLRSGRFGPPVELAADRVRDGRSFTTRRVVARQDGQTILTLEASFHAGEPGDEHQPPPPAVAPPDRCPPLERPPWAQNRPVDLRVVDSPPPPAPAASAPPSTATATAARRTVWVRVAGTVPDDPALHACLLTYLTDMGPAGVVRSSVAAPPGRTSSVSLDHCLWFHRPARADEWLLYDLAAVSTSAARGLVTGSLWTAGGALAATVTQEVLLRTGGPGHRARP